MEVSKLLSLARVKLDDPLFDNSDEGSLFKTSELLEYINSALREVVFRGKLIIVNDLSLNLITGTSQYAAPEGIIVVEEIYDEDDKSLVKVQEIDLKDTSIYYKEDIADLPSHYFQQLTPNKLTFYPVPTKDSIVKVRGSYVPLIEDELGDNDELPVELSEVYHRDLIYWILAEAFDRPDADTYDPKKAGKNEQKFINVFGEKLPADQLAEIMAFPDNPGAMKDY